MEIVSREEFNAKSLDFVEDGVEVERITYLESREELQDDGVAFVKRRVIGGVMMFGGVPVYGWRE